MVWTYARLSAKDGETGTSFIPYYSATGTPYLQNPSVWSETFDPQTHVYICFKVQSSDTVTYSAPARFIGEMVHQLISWEVITVLRN